MRSVLLGSRVILYKKEVIRELLDRLCNCNDIELILNILLRAQFERWQQDDAIELVDFIDTFADVGREPNVVYYMYNPVLCLCMANELLMKIGAAISMVKE